MTLRSVPSSISSLLRPIAFGGGGGSTLNRNSQLGYSGGRAVVQTEAHSRILVIMWVQAQRVKVLGGEGYTDGSSWRVGGGGGGAGSGGKNGVVEAVLQIEA